MTRGEAVAENRNKPNVRGAQVGATTDGRGTDIDQQSTGQRCGRNPATGICLQAIRKSGKPT